MSEKKKENYALFDGELYRLNDKGIFSRWEKLDMPTIEPEHLFKWNGPLIPWKLWEHIILFHRVTVDRFDSETMQLLFLDPENAENPWQVWAPPQDTHGMTVDTDPNHKLYNEERKKYYSMMFGTIHNHVESSAFQSGIDHSDEQEKEGLHITIGKCNAEIMDFHSRMIIGGEQYDISLDQIVELPPWAEKIPASIYNNLKIEDIYSCMYEESGKEEFKKIIEPDFKKISKVVRTWGSKWGSKWGSNYKPNFQGQGNLIGLGDGDISYEMDKTAIGQMENLFPESPVDTWINVDNYLEEEELLYEEVIQACQVPENKVTKEGKQHIKNIANLLIKPKTLKTLKASNFNVTRSSVMRRLEMLHEQFQLENSKEAQERMEKDDARSFLQS